MDWGLPFIIGFCAVCFLGSLIYRSWSDHFYKRPQLSRTQVSIGIDDDTIYLHHIASITEEYVYSIYLTLWGAILGFITYMLFFSLNEFYKQPPWPNIILSVALTTLGGLLGYLGSLDKKTVIRDSSGKTHELNLPEVDRIEFKQEITKDVWKLYK